jgi:polyisoprenoid-binding protein YceI
MKNAGWIALASVLTLAAPLAQAEWTLQKGSELNFLTTKNTHLTEVHTFRTLAGSLQDKGSATLTIDLSSIDSAIPVRDQRMRDVLFETARFASADINTQLDPVLMQQVLKGESVRTTLSGNLTLHGSESPVEALVQVTPASNGTILVSTEGIRKLRDIAGLKAISEVVPVNFTLIFANQAQ